MGKSVLILSGSPRRGGNSDLLCDEFARGASDAGCRVEKIRVAEKRIAFCRGCYCCEDGGVCIHDDDMGEILDKMVSADAIVLASPVYFYSVSAQLKVVIDRTLARWTEVRDKAIYCIVAMADGDPSSAEAALSCLRGYADCVEGGEVRGSIVACGVDEPGDVRGAAAFDEAYRMGRSL